MIQLSTSIIESFQLLKLAMMKELDQGLNLYNNLLELTYLFIFFPQI